jgi:hypothetical protein
MSYCFDVKMTCQDETRAVFQALARSRRVMAYAIVVSIPMLIGALVNGAKVGEIPVFDIWAALFHAGLLLLALPALCVISFLRYTWRDVHVRCERYVLAESGVSVSDGDCAKKYPWKAVKVGRDLGDYRVLLTGEEVHYLRIDDLPAGALQFLREGIEGEGRESAESDSRSDRGRSSRINNSSSTDSNKHPTNLQC